MPLEMLAPHRPSECEINCKEYNPVASKGSGFFAIDRRTWAKRQPGNECSCSVFGAGPRDEPKQSVD